MDVFTRHGGRLDAAMRERPDAPRPWIDLSTGINPHPYPAPRAGRAARGRLPFASEIATLESVAASAFGVADSARVVAAPGAEAGLRLLPHVLRSDTAAIAGPTYASHADAWTRAGARLGAQDDCRVCIVVNPNNPDGRVMAQADLLALADRLAARGGWLIVDESFADASPGPGIAATGHPRIIVIRSFGKFYGLAGLRLGFLIGDPGLMQEVRGVLGDWPVSADAIAAGMAAYADGAWGDRARARLARGAAWLDKALQRSGFQVVGGTTLFRLTRTEDAARRFAVLCEHGILCRPFDDEPRWLRFGLPRDADRGRVAAALAACA
jgi:cobalamin biosynthetic protein CobC